MLLKKTGAAGILLMVIASLAVAQNARRDALGGTTVIGDMVDILTNPADVCDYVDAVQVTYDGSVGPAIVVKGIGDLLRVGLWYDDQTVANSRILSDFSSPLSLDPIPHLLLGMDFEAVQLGLDLYWERAIFKSKEEDTRDFDNDGTNSNLTTTHKSTLMNPGFRFGINLPEMMDMDLWIKSSFPGFKSDTLQEISGDSSYTYEKTIKSEFPALDLDAGWEITLPISVHDLYIGFEGGLATFGKTVTSETNLDDTTTGSNHFVADIGAYTGITREIIEHEVLTGIMIAGGIVFDRDAPDEITYTNKKTLDNTLYLLIAGGVEKEWSTLKRLDAIQARCGLLYGVLEQIEHESGDSASNEYKLRVKNTAVRSGLDAYLGMGVTKSVFQFDLQIAPAAILNAFKLVQGTYNSGGNDFVKATVTVDFGGGSYGGASDFSSSTPSYDTSTETSTEAGGTTDTDEGFDF
ncbi:MAG: hypothetical protein GF401_01060 [Chitinivibrionales bacterium]|nr:hypothetical protein [Chitinivibrionales bacterium]